MSSRGDVRNYVSGGKGILILPHRSGPPLGYGKRRGGALVAPISFGAASGSNPVSGSASWRGVAVGTQTHRYWIGNRIAYDAELEFDFASATLDLTLDPESGLGSIGEPSWREIAWHGVPVADGAFAARGLDGCFYGPNHEEAGGIFENGDAQGAFVLRRQ